MEPPLVLSREQVRRVDEIAVQQYGFSSLVLMENAGRGVVDVLLAVDPSLVQLREMHRGSGAPIRFEHPVTILCGKGNNAGDGFVIARHLLLRRVNAKVILLTSPEQLAGDARRNYEILSRCDVPLIELSSGVTANLLDEHGGDAAWLVDAMLGTGAVGEPREPMATAIHWMNRHLGRRLAVDLPSGLDCDTGAAASATVRADVTCTFVALKPGFLRPEARPFLGQIHIVSIGTPPALLPEVM